MLLNSGLGHGQRHIQKVIIRKLNHFRLGWCLPILIPIIPSK